MPYCGNCGAANNHEYKFCQNCGFPLLQQQAQPSYYIPPPPPTQPTAEIPIQQPLQKSYSESVMGVMLLRNPKSMGRYDTYTGIVTTHRLIFAQMTSEMLNTAIQIAKDQAKAEGKGFWGQWGDQLKAAYSYTNRYLHMDPNAALSETPGNFFVNNMDIKEVEIKIKDLHKPGEKIHRHEFELEIHTPHGNYKFRMDNRKEYLSLLKQTYGEKMRMPFGYFPTEGFTINL
ncbi:MAG: zinc ribbon domain-containing protein [Candidatus Bathyarchaeota archaeon]|nr:zinc ribbon domain-containing protein [Candidatus Bathyarchaeota archaeon]